LGNIVSSLSSLPSPLGEFFGQNPLAGITLNQFRNIGAHKDFSVYKDVITLFPKTQKIMITLQDLENGLEIAGKIREPLRLTNIISCQYLRVARLQSGPGAHGVQEVGGSNALARLSPIRGPIV
jgi:hypothetical protein